MHIHIKMVLKLNFMISLLQIAIRNLFRFERITLYENANNQNSGDYSNNKFFSIKTQKLTC